MEPPRRTRLRGTIQGLLEFSRPVKGGPSPLGTHQRLPPANPQTKYGPFPSTGVTPLLRYRMGRSDSRSALVHFTGIPPIGLDAPRPSLRWQPKDLTAGAETGLSCSHDGCLTVPRPLRRRVPRGCASKLLTPSMAFAVSTQARLPVDPSRGKSFRRGRLRLMLRTGELHPPEEGSTPRYDAQVSPNVGGLLQRCLGASFDRTCTG